MSWLTVLKERSVLDVARELDLFVVDGGRHLGPCPECHEERRSRRDRRRGPLFVTKGGRGWCCGRCGARGSVVDLLALSLFGERLAARDPRWRQLRQHAAGLGLASPPEAGGAPAFEPEPPQRIDAAALTALWEAGDRADEDRSVAAWLARRGFDPELVADRDLCRALPAQGLPRWARFRGAPWSVGWRAIFRAFDAAGQLASLRARWVLEEAPPDGGEKTGAAAGGPGSAGQAVLSCGIGAQVLAHGVAPGWWDPAVPFEIVICEGEPDWLTWTARHDAPPSFGLFAGAWSDDIAARVPDGARVAIRAHTDATGLRYGRAVARALWDRCEVYGPTALLEAL